jgi:hypothetical protein
VDSVNSDEKGARDKSSLYLRKIEEERICNQKLKLEIGTLKKYLLREIGPDIQLNKLQNDAGWKGRQEQIMLLKEKIIDLKQKTDATNPLENEFSNHRQSLSNQKVSVIRRQDLAKANDEIQQYKDNSQQLKMKHEASVSRVRCLEREFRDLRLKMNVCLEKGTNDDSLILALQSELIRLKALLFLISEPKQV